MKIKELESDKHINSTSNNEYTDKEQDDALMDEYMVIHSASHGSPSRDIGEEDTDLMTDNIADAQFEADAECGCE